MNSRTVDCLIPLMHSVLRWARIAHEEDHKEMIGYTLGTAHYLNQAPPEKFGYLLPDMLDLMLATKRTMELFSKSKNEPRCEKTGLPGSDQVRHKPGCTVTVHG